jgi:peptidyl-prolyl cis-trans isomerase SurA
MIKRLTVLACLLLPLMAGAKVEMLDRIVAVVNDGVIMQSELDARVDEIRQRIAGQGQGVPPADVLEQQVLDRMIEEKVQLQLAERGGLKVDDSDLNQAISSIAQRNGMTLEQFSESVRQQGQDWAAFREQIRREMIINQLQQRQVSQRIRITDREVNRFLESSMGQRLFESEFHLGHILISVPPEADSEAVQQAREKAEAVLADLRGGANFQDTAIARSDGQLALEGGDLGWRPAAQLPSLFAETAVDLEPGELSDLIRSGAGFHILKLKDKRGGDTRMVEQHQVRHILIAADALTKPAQAERQARELRRRIADGEDFAELARQFSDDPGSAREGGSLGWVSPGEMVPTFERVMDSTNVGEVSSVFETRFGWHFLQVMDTRTADMSEQYREMKARQALSQRRFEEELQRWLQEKRGEAYIDIRL